MFMLHLDCFVALLLAMTVTMLCAILNQVEASLSTFSFQLSTKCTCAP